MALTNEVVVFGGGILLALGLATYLIGRRSRVRAGIFLAFALLILVALNAV